MFEQPLSPQAVAKILSDGRATPEFFRWLDNVDAVIRNRPAFAADKGASPQTGVPDSTWTQITFPVELYDVGGYFASNLWTPAAGKVAMAGAVFVTGTFPAGTSFGIAIYKNGGLFKSVFPGSIFASQASAGIAIEDQAGGSDTYGLYAYIDLTSGTGTFEANNNSFFAGHWIGP